jgi:hypothetical protein
MACKSGDNKTIETVDKFVKILSNYIHDKFVEQKFTTDKKILDTYPIELGVSGNNYNYSKDLSIYSITYINKPDKDGKTSEVLRFIPSVYHIILKTSLDLFDILNIQYSEFIYYIHQTREKDLDIQINMDNLKYTIKKIYIVGLFRNKIDIVIKILD